jgi:hypothetical protein
MKGNWARYLSPRKKVNPDWQKCKMSLLSRLNIFEALVQGILSNPVFLATVQQFHVSSVFSVFKFNEQKWTKCLKMLLKTEKSPGVRIIIFGFLDGNYYTPM